VVAIRARSHRRGSSWPSGVFEGPTMISSSVPTVLRFVRTPRCPEPCQASSPHWVPRPGLGRTVPSVIRSAPGSARRRWPSRSHLMRPSRASAMTSTYRRRTRLCRRAAPPRRPNGVPSGGDAEASCRVLGAAADAYHTPARPSRDVQRALYSPRLRRHGHVEVVHELSLRFKSPRRWWSIRALRTASGCRGLRTGLTPALTTFL